MERVAGKTPSLPILQNILFSLKKNKVCLSGTDLQMGITCEFLAKTEQEGDVVFAPRFITPLLGVITEEKISIQGENNQLILEAGNFHTTVQTVNSEEFPIIPSLKEEDPFIEIQTDIFCKGLVQVVSMAGQSQARPEIGGVFFVFEKELLRLVATDSFRLAEKKLVFEKKNSFEGAFILPQKTAREVVGILGERQGKTKIYVSSSQVIFDYNSQEEASQAHIQIVSRLIEGEYPDYQSVIPRDHKTKIIFQKEEFLSHIKAASLFSGKTGEVVLSVDPVKKRVSFAAKSSDAGENKSFLDAETAGDAMSVAFNWRFLMDGILQMKSSRIEFLLNGEDGPALLRAGDQEGYVYVIMPIKG